MNHNEDYRYAHGVQRSASSKMLYAFFHRKILTLFCAIVLSVLCVAGTAGVFLLVGTQPKASLDELYSAATIDAITIEPDEIFSLVYEQIFESVWNDSYIGDKRRVISHISELRKKLDKSDCIKSVHDVGYKLNDK